MAMGKRSIELCQMVESLSIDRREPSKMKKLPPPRPNRKNSGSRALHFQTNNHNTISTANRTCKSKPKESWVGRTHIKSRPVPLKPLTNAEHTNISCRFILKPDTYLTPETINVDKPIPSHLLWRVISTEQECPICLEVAEVPRMLGCGHIMCLHCLLKHRIYSEKPEICPICGEVVAMSPLRTLPVSFIHSDPNFLPKDGDEVILTLMARRTNSCIAVPVGFDHKSLGFPGPHCSRWTRVCEGSIEYAKEELAKERTYLIQAAKKNQEELGSDEGYSAAITEIIKYQQQLNRQPIGNDQDTVVRDTAHRAPMLLPIDDPSSRQNGTIYFYQTAFESTVIYTLDPLDVSILRNAFGDFSNFPSVLLTKVQNIEFSYFDRVRDKHLKYLAHLPEQTQVAFMECDWTGVVSEEVLKKYKSRLDHRKKTKMRKQAQEHAERQKAEASIENQFKVQIAEALLPHGDIGFSDSRGIDTSQLPTLPMHTSKADARQKHWVDETKEYEELMKNAYIPKRGRKDIVLRF